MLIGIARTSTLEQKAGLEAQLRELEAYGCEKIYQEQGLLQNHNPPIAVQTGLV